MTVTLISVKGKGSFGMFLQTGLNHTMAIEFLVYLHCDLKNKM